MSSATTDQATFSQENVLLGSIYICISATMFAVAGAAVKLALHDVSPVQLVFWRNLMSMVFFFGFLLAVRPAAFSCLRSEMVGLHLLRSVLSLCVLYAYFYAVSQIDLATAVLLLSTSPVFVPILALLFMRHLSASTVWIGVLIAFVGVALVVDPTLKYSFDFSNYIGLGSGLLSGILGGAATVVIWKMSGTESPDRQMIYFTFVSFVLSMPFVLLAWEMPKPVAFVPIVCLGIATTLAQYFLAKGCEVAPADKINTWNYLSIVIAGLAAYVGWNETLRPVTILGMILVVVGARIAGKTFKGSR